MAARKRITQKLGSKDLEELFAKEDEEKEDELVMYKYENNSAHRES